MKKQGISAGAGRGRTMEEEEEEDLNEVMACRGRGLNRSGEVEACWGLQVENPRREFEERRSDRVLKLRFL